MSFKKIVPVKPADKAHKKPAPKRKPARKPNRRPIGH